jgi:hypothetical protein
MTREQLNKWWKEIEAFKVGKVIQFLNIDREWYDDPIPSFSLTHEFRIKPEPELIPFDYSDAEYLIGKAVKRKDNSKYIQTIVQVNSDQVYIGAGIVTFKILLEKCTFLDGTPCGKHSKP